MENFEIRNKKAWARIEAEKVVQLKLKKEAGLDKHCCSISENQMIVAQYLEEMGLELLHVLPKGREVEYLENTMVSMNIALVELIKEFSPRTN